MRGDAKEIVKRYNLKIGQPVRVEAVLTVVRLRDEREIFFTPLTEPVDGVVVGLKRLYAGTVEWYGEVRELVPKGSIVAVLVRTGWLNKQLLAAPQSLVPLDKYELPILKMRQAPYSEEYREELRRAAKEIPRDKKGRFLPLPPTGYIPRRPLDRYEPKR